MIKNQKGITLVSLIITIALMLIIASTTVYTSYKKFEINNLRKMNNDLKLLTDKVENYNLKYNGLPILRDSQNNNPIICSLTLPFDNLPGNNYYFLDLAALGDIILNYGKEGYEDAKNNDENISSDVYIINKNTHIIYYVKGIQMNDKTYYLLAQGEAGNDTIAPTKPEIKVVNGEQDINGNYIGTVILEFIPGKDNWSGVNNTTYLIEDEDSTQIATRRYS